MAVSNSGAVKEMAKAKAVDVINDMAAYDRLPKVLRDTMKNMVFDTVAADARLALRMHHPSKVVSMLQELDRECVANRPVFEMPDSKAFKSSLMTPRRRRGRRPCMQL